MSISNTSSEFRSVFETQTGSDQFFLFLQNIFHLYPEDRFHDLITQACKTQKSDATIYQAVQKSLPDIRTFLSSLTYGLPALRKQKNEMAKQTCEALGGRTAFNGYLEIGSTGRYISRLRKDLTFSGPLYISNDVAPGNGPGDIMERGQFRKLGQFLPLNYQPLMDHGIKPNSLDLVTCYIGLHHAPIALLDGFVDSIRTVLRPGGVFVMRDHDATNDERTTFCSLVHTVFNLGLDISWDENVNEVRHFRSAEEWASYLNPRGLHDQGVRLLQQHDPSDNTLMVFEKQNAEVRP